MKAMEIIKIATIVLEAITSVALIVIVLLQSGKESGLGVVSGNSDSYMNKSGSGNLSKKLASATKWVALVWIVLILALCMII